MGHSAVDLVSQFDKSVKKIMYSAKSFAILALAAFGDAATLRGSQDEVNQEHRRLAAYYSTSDATVLGAPSPDAAIGNPLKGLLTSPTWTGGNTQYSIPSSLEFHYIGMDSVMTGDNKFDWTGLDSTISGAASRNNHVIWRIYVDYPGRPLALPRYLIDAGVPLVPRGDGGASPQYDDPKLLKAFEQLIAAMGAKYDGHKSIAFIQLGLLGKWGEWHTYPENGLLSDATQDKVVEWYKNAFPRTKKQARGITRTSIESGVGLHDDSFAYSTTGSVNWFFWPKVNAAGKTNFWKQTVMGGETRPELQNSVFDPSYVPGDTYKQDFMQCVETTHATYMFHHAAFISGNFQGEELNRARRAHARMGYNFEVSNVAVSQSSSAGRVVVDVTVKQVGVAPFYYPLSLALNCQGTSATLTGVETLIESGATKVFSFASVPADSTCLSSVRLSLESSMAYTGKPIKFAQGNGSVVLNLPLPSGTSPGPAPAPASTFFVDARSHTGPRFTLTSTTLTTMPNAVAGTSNYQGDLFRHHRWHKGGFTYTISGFAAGASYAVTLGFAEIWEPNCAKGKRIFEVLANGSLIVSNLDVFAVAGCKKAYTTTKTVAANASGKIELKFVAVAENPFVSFIDVKAA